MIWLTGNSGSGKTTLGQILAERYGAILLDGDRMRATISREAGFSKEERSLHNLRVAMLAKELSNQGLCVIVSVIAPFRDTRRRIDKVAAPLWIYLKRESVLVTMERPYEPPGNAVCVVDTDADDIPDCVEQITTTLDRLFQ